MGIYDEYVRERCAREFFTPEPISRTGNYYPRYQTTWLMETGSCHVSYLARPLFGYSVPSRYGFSKYDQSNRRLVSGGNAMFEFQVG